MWIPAGLVYVIAGLAVAARLLGSTNPRTATNRSPRSALLATVKWGAIYRFNVAASWDRRVGGGGATARFDESADGNEPKSA